MEIATLIFVLSFFAIVSVLVTSTIRYMCKKKNEVDKRVPLSKKVSITKEQLKEIELNTLNSYGLTKEKAERISKLTEQAYLTKYEPLTTLCSGDFYKSLTYIDGTSTQEKWKETVPKHSTRIKLRASRKLRNKRKGYSKGVRGKNK